MLKGAKEIITNALYTRASNKKSKSNLDLASIQIAKKKYFNATGREMTPSRLKSDSAGIVLPKATQQYLKDRTSARKDYKKRFGL